MSTILRSLRNAFWPSPVWENPREVSYAENMCSLLSADETGLTITKDGQKAFVVELYGKDFSGLDSESVFTQYLSRKTLFDNLPTEISMFSQSHRVEEAVTTDFEAFTNPMARKVAESHYTAFSKTFRTKHYLIFTDSRDIGLEKLGKAVERVAGRAKVDTDALLKRTVEDAVFKLSEDYGARLLKGDDLVSYWAWMLTGYPVHQSASEDGLLDDILCRSRIEFGPLYRDYMTYGTTHGPLYSAWFMVKRPPRSMNQAVFDTLYSVQEMFSVYQTFARMEKSQAMAALEKRSKNVHRHMKANAHHAVEIASMQEEVQSDTISQFYTRFALEIFGKDRDSLELAIRNVSKALEGHGFGLARETVNREGLFWSRFPGMERCNSRLKETTSMSAPYSTTFANVGEGFSKCSWGKAPVHLKTLAGSVFSWTWHHSPADKALGNTLVIGGSEVGKTTLVNFLCDKCFQYPDFKVVAFDRLSGMRVWTKCMGGIYIANEDITRQSLNPLQMPDTPDNRVVLSNWVQMLTGKLGEDDKDALAKGLSQVIEDLGAKDRNLTELHSAVSTTSKEAAKRLRKWLPDSEYGAYFNGAFDSLDFSDTQLVTFDMTRILDIKDVVGPLSYYIFCKIFQAMEKQGGYAVIIDELPKYLRNPDFKDHIPVLLQEIRKTDGIFISMVQSADHILRHEAAQAFLNNTATYLLFPEPRAMAEDYMKVMGLNEKEFHWIKTTDPKSRQVLMKRRGGESVFLDVNLAHLGPLFNIYNSSTDAVQRLKALEEDGRHDYVSQFLGI